MNGHEKWGLGALALIALCLTVVISIVFIALWQQREIVAWCVLGLTILGTLVGIGHSLNEMSLRHRRYHHQYESPLDTHGYPTLLQTGQQPYRTWYAHSVMRGRQPHDGEECGGYGSE